MKLSPLHNFYSKLQIACHRANNGAMASVSRRISVRHGEMPALFHLTARSYL